MRIIGWLRDLFRKKHHWYAVTHKRTGAWFTGEQDDLWSVEFGRSEWYDEPAEAMLAISLAMHDPAPSEVTQLMQLTIRFDSNHYKMRAIDWSW